MNIKTAFLLTTIAGFSTIIGTFTIFLSKKKTLNFLIGGMSFASSIMLFVSLFDLIPEGIIFLSKGFTKIKVFLISFVFIIIGFGISKTIDKLFPNDEKQSLYKVGIITLIGIIVHNIPEGIATFITTNNNLTLGISLTLAITIHNIPEGISIALPIYYHTRSYKKAFLLTIACALSEPFGALIAYLFLKPTPITLGIVYSIISGIMIYIALFELLPEAYKYKRYRIINIFYILGLIVSMISKLLF